MELQVESQIEGVEVTERDQVLMRFADKVALPDDLNDKEPCWLWQGARHSKKRGYGKFWFNGKVMNAHKVSHILFVGPVEEGLVVGHQCNNEFCVSPHHLVAQTQADNIQYAVICGRLGKK